MDSLYETLVNTLKNLLLHPKTDPDEAEILTDTLKDVLLIWEDNLKRRVAAKRDIVAICDKVLESNPDPCTLDQQGLSRLLIAARGDLPV